MSFNPHNPINDNMPNGCDDCKYRKRPVDSKPCEDCVYLSSAVSYYEPKESEETA